MPSLKTLRIRITSVKSTQKITKAMQMVAAAKLRRAQSAAEAARPYAEHMQAVMSALAGSIDDKTYAPKLLAGTGRDSVHLLVVTTSDRGLCGGFNTQIVRLCRDRIETLRRQGKTVKILTVGRKGRDALRRLYGPLIIDSMEFSGVRQIGFAEARMVTENILGRFDNGEFDVATLFYSRFKNVLTQTPTAQQLIPAEIPQAKPGDAARAFYEFEPDENEILASLLPRNIAVQIFRALLENAAGFFGAQMNAMDNATRNAGKAINRLTLTFNRTRQAVITKELIEIISGAEAL